MAELTVHVDGMGCRDCVRSVTAVLRDVPGVETVTADHRRSLVVLVGGMTASDVLVALEGTRFRSVRLVADSDGTGSGQPPA